MKTPKNSPKKSFPYQTVGLDTQILFFDDVKKSFKKDTPKTPMKKTPLKTPMKKIIREAPFQKRIIAGLEKKGWYVIKLIQTNKNGIPDLLALKKGYRPLFIEVKGTGTHVAKLQEYRLGQLAKLDCDAQIWSPMDDGVGVNVRKFYENKFEKKYGKL